MYIKKSFLKFVIPSLLGIVIFLVPFSLHGEVNTLIGHSKELLLTLIGGRQHLVVVIVSFAAASLTIASRFFAQKWIIEGRMLSESLDCAPLWFAARICSLPVAIAVLFGADFGSGCGAFFSLFVEKATFIVNFIAVRLVVLALVLGLWAPLILDFGLVQFTAVFASRIMRPLFLVPGRGALDCITSLLGSSSMAVVFTARMYDDGYYTDREAAAIVCSFSVASIYNIYMLADLFDMEHAMLQILFVVYVCTFVLATILPRIWPLAYMPDTYYKGCSNYHINNADQRHKYSLATWAVLRGVSSAQRMNTKTYLRNSFAIICGLLLNTVPLIITFGTLFIIIAEATNIADLLFVPFADLLKTFDVPEAKLVASTTAFSFVDQFLAAAKGQMLYTGQARFICVCFSLIGLINLTEVGLHVWHSNIPLRFWQMAAVYLMRLIFSLPIVLLSASVFFPLHM